MVVDENNREAARHYIARALLLKFRTIHTYQKVINSHPPKRAMTHVVISRFGDPYSEPIIAEADGVVKFQDIIVGVTAVEQFDELTGESRLTLNEYIPSTYKPAIVLATNGEQVITYPIEPKTTIFVKDGSRVKIVDILAKNSEGCTEI